MPIDASVAELLTAQLFLLVQEAPDPIYFYINSTGIAVGVPLTDACEDGGMWVRAHSGVGRWELHGSM